MTKQPAHLRFIDTKIGARHKGRSKIQVERFSVRRINTCNVVLPANLDTKRLGFLFTFKAYEGLLGRSIPQSPIRPVVIVLPQITPDIFPGFLQVAGGRTRCDEFGKIARRDLRTDGGRVCLYLQMDFNVSRIH